MKGYRIRYAGLRPVELKCFFLPFLIQFDSFTKHNGNFTLINNIEYMYFTYNDRKCQKASKCLLRNGTKSKNTYSYILLDHFNAFGLSRNKLFSIANNGEGEDFLLCPLLGPRAI